MSVFKALFLIFGLSFHALAFDEGEINEYDLEIGTFVKINDVHFDNFVFYVYAFGSFKDVGRRYLISFNVHDFNQKSRLIDYNPTRRMIDLKRTEGLPQVLVMKEAELIKNVGLGLFKIWQEVIQSNKWVKKYKKIAKKF